MSKCSAGPHDFRPMKWHDRFSKNGRCFHCFFPRGAHPIRNFWAEARPLHDPIRLTQREAVDRQFMYDARKEELAS